MYHITDCRAGRVHIFSKTVVVFVLPAQAAQGVFDQVNNQDTSKSALCLKPTRVNALPAARLLPLPLSGIEKHSTHGARFQGHQLHTPIQRRDKAIMTRKRTSVASRPLSAVPREGRWERTGRQQTDHRAVHGTAVEERTAHRLPLDTLHL